MKQNWRGEECEIGMNTKYMPQEKTRDELKKEISVFIK